MKRGNKEKNVNGTVQVFLKHCLTIWGFTYFKLFFTGKVILKLEDSLILTSNLIVYLKFLIKLDTKSFVISLG